MNARYFTSRQQSLMEQAVSLEFARRADDLTKRAQFIWADAMLEANIPAAEINRVIALVPERTAFYARYSTDQLGDYVVHERLAAAGVELEMTEEEN